MKTESPYRRVLRLRKEIQCLENTIRGIEKSAVADRVHLGFKKIGKSGSEFSVTQSNTICISGEIRSDVLNFANIFDFRYSHENLMAELSGFQVFVELDDGRLKIQLGYDIENHQDAAKNHEKNLKQVFRFFKSYGIKIVTDRLENEITGLKKTLAEKQQVLSTLNQTPILL